MNDHEDAGTIRDRAPKAGEPPCARAGDLRRRMRRDIRDTGPTTRSGPDPEPLVVVKPTLGNVALALDAGSVLLSRCDFGAPR
ncbi:hypothetical protein ACQP00_19540 [Dactylosporangium sp. CS-047395]|uniref:hypothetical protein n=1 Tax=Dactylosporangium sp. CS-047395 TaxID=3239936 RepID=UPI003D917F14